MITGIYGINVAVKDLEAAIKNYEVVFGVKSEPIPETGFAFRGLRGAKISVNGFNINLITSDNPDTAIAKFLKEREGFFLLSVTSDEIEADLEALAAKGLKPLLSNSAKGEFGAVNFYHPKLMNGVQLELYQPKT